MAFDNCGLPIQDVDHEDFDICIHSCELAEIQFEHSPGGMEKLEKTVSLRDYIESYRIS